MSRIFTEEHRRKIGEANSRRVVTEETKRKISESRKLLFSSSQEAHENMSKAMKGKPSPRKGVVLSDEIKTRISQNRTGKGVGNKNAKRKEDFTEMELENLRYRMVGNEIRKGAKLTDETKRKIAESRVGKSASEETKKKMSECRTGEKNPNWNGGPKDYCIKFKYGTFRNRCRAYFDNVCVLCGQPAGEETLDVHHVYYNKKACCDVSEDGKYYSDLGIKGAPKTFEIIGDPNKFVPLHHKCHSLTTPKPVREHYARHFEKVINEQYDGKCYYTEEEYAGLCEPEPST
jgi:hypothetical protein